MIKIRIPLLLWRSLKVRLKRQGAGVRESGAFLLGGQHGVSGRVTRFVCYDELDPEAYDSGGIAFHAAGYATLWQYCRKHELQVLADAHTHPGINVGQSAIDRNNPMMPMVGHTAIILPNFASTPWWSLSSAGVYEYLGGFEWRSFPTFEKSQRVSLTLTLW